MPHTVAFYTLGCKLNFAETSTISRQLMDKGFEKVEFTSGADMYVINTCSVTDHADRKCKKVVNEVLRYNPKAYIVIVGCYAQLKPEEIAAIPGVDMVLGAAEKFNLIEHLHSLVKEENAIVKNAPIKEVNTFVPGFSEGDRTRTFLKVQDGCDYFCTFCTIPLARGQSRSATVKETIARVKEIAKDGIKEVVLTGVNLGDFGINHGETFFDLVKELDQIETIDRYRISSIEPNLLSNDIIHFVSKSKKFVPHFHIPLQSGEDELLQRMRRKYDSNLYKERINYIFEVMPNCSIGVDVIIGFPGETEEMFQTTYDFLKDLEVSYLHVFPYSNRGNTTANKMKDQVPVKVRMERSERMRILGEKLKQAFYRKNEQTEHVVLFELEERNGMMHGFTENYIKVRAPYDPLQTNELVNMKLNSVNTDGTMDAEMIFQPMMH